MVKKDAPLLPVYNVVKLIMEYVEFDPNQLIVKEMADAILLIEKSYPARKLLVYQSNFHPDFFDLSTGLAGEVLQKIANYRVQTAFVVDIASIKSERFKELINETNFNDEYRFFNSKEEAEKWLNS